jgi:hypothetical protein
LAPKALWSFYLDENVTFFGYNTIARNCTSGFRIYYNQRIPVNRLLLMLLPYTNLIIKAKKNYSITVLSEVAVRITSTGSGADPHPYYDTTPVTVANGNDTIIVCSYENTNYTINLNVPNPPAGYNTFVQTTQAIYYNASSSLAVKDLNLMWLYKIKYTITDLSSNPHAGASITANDTPNTATLTTGLRARIVVLSATHAEPVRRGVVVVVHSAAEVAEEPAPDVLAIIWRTRPKVGVLAHVVERTVVFAAVARGQSRKTVFIGGVSTFIRLPIGCGFHLTTGHTFAAQIIGQVSPFGIAGQVPAFGAKDFGGFPIV